MMTFLLIGLPLFSGFLLPSLYRFDKNMGRIASPLILAITLLTAMTLWFHVYDAGEYSFAFGGFPIPLSIMFYVDSFALLFICLMLMITLILWYGSEQDNEKSEIFTLWLVAAGSGLMLSGDLFNIYLFYEMMSIATYGLLVSSRAQAVTYAATIRYVILNTLGSSFALLGIALIYAATGTLNLSHLAIVGAELLNTSIGLTAFVLMLIGFGVKAELFMLNTWVSEIYATTTTRVAALLSSIVSKLAIVVILRLLILIYADTEAAHLLLGLGILGVLSGELAALRSSNLRQILAYFSIAQLGLIAIAFSIPNQAGISVGILLALHHAIVKSALFILAEKWSSSISGFVGIAKTSLISVILYLILVLSLIGIPPLMGFWAKFSLFNAALNTGEQVYSIAVFVMIAAMLIEATYFMQIARLMFQQSTAESIDETKPEPITKTELMPAFALTGILLITSLTIGFVQMGLNHIATQVLDKNHYIETSMPTWQREHPDDF